MALMMMTQIDAMAMYLCEMKKIPSDHKTQKHYFNMNGVIKLSKCLYLYLARWDREPNLRFSSAVIADTRYADAKRTRRTSSWTRMTEWQSLSLTEILYYVRNKPPFGRNYLQYRHPLDIQRHMNKSVRCPRIEVRLVYLERRLFW